VIDSLKYGNDKNITFDMGEAFSEHRQPVIEVSLILPNGKVLVKEGYDIPENDYYHEQMYRVKTIDMVRNCSEKKKYDDMSFVEDINSLIDEMKSPGELLMNTTVQNMVHDLHGQVKEALNMTSKGKSENWYERWGRHYLLSLAQAYENEVCNNFKDKGISGFGGDLFNKLRDEISDIFDGLPAPKSRVVSYRGGYRGGGQVARAPVNMSSYNDPGGGCCAPEALVLLDNYTYKQAQDITKGDKVITVDESFNQIVSAVECVVQKTCPHNLELLVQLEGGLRITPWHPVISSTRESWEFPAMMDTAGIMECSHVYSFVTNNRKPMILNDYIYATLGHGLSGDVIQHDYFGTDRVINDLKVSESYEMGFVSLVGSMFKRDPVSSKVWGISVCEETLTASL